MLYQHQTLYRRSTVIRSYFFSRFPPNWACFSSTESLGQHSLQHRSYDKGEKSYTPMAGGCIGICDFPEVEQLVPEKLPKPKRTFPVFQPSFFRGKLAVKLQGSKFLSNMFYFHPYLGEIFSNLTSIFFRWVGEKPPTRFVWCF